MTNSPQNMSFAEIDTAVRELSADGGAGGAGPAGEADLTASSMAPTMEVAMAVIGAIADIVNDVTGPKPAAQQQQQTSSFFQPSASRAKNSSFMTAAPVAARQVEIVPMSYGQKKAAARELQGSRFINARVLAGANMNGPRGGTDIFGNALADRIRIADKSIGKDAHAIKGVKSKPKLAVLTPEDALQMGLPGKAAELAALLRARNEPSLRTIELSMGNDQRGQLAMQQLQPELRADMQPKAPAPSFAPAQG